MFISDNAGEDNDENEEESGDRRKKRSPVSQGFEPVIVNGKKQYHVEVMLVADWLSVKT